MKNTKHLQLQHNYIRQSIRFEGLSQELQRISKASQTEMAELIHWCELHSHLRNRHPFSEILPVVEAACEDNVLTEDESKDILWLCGNFVDDAGYYDQITSSIQFLAGLIHGVMADGTLLDTEIKAIRSWIQTNDYLAGVYPYDEINSLLSVILEDKVITSDERDQLMAFFSNLIEFQDSLNLNANEFESLRNRCKISGICATCPTIHFTNHTFCFTGEFQRGKRSDLERTVSELGGICRCICFQENKLPCCRKPWKSMLGICLLWAKNRGSHGAQKRGPQRYYRKRN